MKIPFSPLGAFFPSFVAASRQRIVDSLNVKKYRQCIVYKLTLTNCKPTRK